MLAIWSSHNSCVYLMMRFKGTNGKMSKMMTSHELYRDETSVSSHPKFVARPKEFYLIVLFVIFFSGIFVLGFSRGAWVRVFRDRLDALHLCSVVSPLSSFGQAATKPQAQEKRNVLSFCLCLCCYYSVHRTLMLVSLLMSLMKTGLKQESLV